MNDNTIQKKAYISANVPRKISDAIEEFQRRHNFMFRTDAIIKIVEVACQAVGIDLENLPKPQSKPQEEEETLDLDKKIPCPQSNRVGTYWRCQNCAKKEPARFKECEAIPSEWREDIIGEQPEEEAKEPEPTPQPEPQKTINTVTTETEEQTQLTKEWICLKNKPKDPNPTLQQAKCNTCKASDWSTWKACQDLKRQYEREKE